MSMISLTIILFLALIVSLALGLPLCFVFGGVATVFIVWQMGFDALYIIVATAWPSWSNFVLVAAPLFILMALFIHGSGIAENLYEAMYRWMGGLRGGLAMGTVVICAFFAAMAGISGVGTLTMGLIALPAMLKRGYDKDIAVGCISAGGTLGILIPPSGIMIIYAFVVEESVGKLFMGGVFSGLMVASLMVAYIGVRCYFQPHLGPPIKEQFSLKEKLIHLRALILPILLILLVLGAIYTGAATPTEAAGVGAFGAFLITIITRRFSLALLRNSLLTTVRVTCMVLWIILGAKIFVHIYSVIGAQDMVYGFMTGLELNRWFILLVMQIILIALGMFIDPAGIVMIVGPIFLPIAISLGFDPIFYGILFTINMELGYITPPFGFNLFYMKSIAEPLGVSMGDIYRSIVPFVFVELLGMIVLCLFPQLATWLPSTMVRG